jgi:hypothetical protein
MNLKDFRELEKELGHPPTAKEVKAKKPRFKTAYVQFSDSKYDYRTSVNGKLSDEEIIRYFKHQIFNLGSIADDVQVCMNCTVEPSKL